MAVLTAGLCLLCLHHTHRFAKNKHTQKKPFIIPFIALCFGDISGEQPTDSKSAAYLWSRATVESNQSLLVRGVIVNESRAEQALRYGQVIWCK